MQYSELPNEPTNPPVILKLSYTGLIQLPYTGEPTLQFLEDNIGRPGTRGNLEYAFSQFPDFYIMLICDETGKGKNFKQLAHLVNRDDTLYGECLFFNLIPNPLDDGDMFKLGALSTRQVGMVEDGLVVINR